MGTGVAATGAVKHHCVMLTCITHGCSRPARK
jgi:hypothetical protein